MSFFTNKYVLRIVFAIAIASVAGPPALMYRTLQQREALRVDALAQARAFHELPHHISQAQTNWQRYQVATCARMAGYDIPQLDRETAKENLHSQIDVTLNSTSRWARLEKREVELMESIKGRIDSIHAALNEDLNFPNYINLLSEIKSVERDLSRAMYRVSDNESYQPPTDANPPLSQTEFWAAMWLTCLALIAFYSFYIAQKERAKLERKLLESQKSTMEAMGGVLSGFLHLMADNLSALNNSLTAYCWDNNIDLRKHKSDARLRTIASTLRQIMTLDNNIRSSLMNQRINGNIKPLREILSQVQEHDLEAEQSQNTGWIISSNANDIALPEIPFRFTLKELVSNAWKAEKLHPSDKCFVSCSVHVRGGNLEIEVRNHALIPEKIMENLFQPFVPMELDDRTRHSGMGLYTIKSIASKMFGDVTCTSTPVSRTAFKLSYPLGGMAHHAANSGKTSADNRGSQIYV